MNFDMGTTWSRAMDLVRDNFQLLAVIAGIFLLLPTLAAYMLIPDIQTMMDPTADPDVVAAQMQEIIGPLILVGLVAMVFQFAGYAAMVALMGETRPTVGEALKTGFKATPSLFGVLVVFMITYVLAAIVVAIPIGVIANLAGLPALSILAVLLVFAVVVYLLARMSMSMPVLVLEDTLNPLRAVARSFALTGPKQWAILLFWGVLFFAYMVVALLLTGVFGVIAAMAGSGAIATLILGLANGAIGMIVGMVVCGLAVAMYGQLAGPSEDDITETFE